MGNCKTKTPSIDEDISSSPNHEQEDNFAHPTSPDFIAKTIQNRTSKTKFDNSCKLSHAENGEAADISTSGNGNETPISDELNFG